MDFIAKLPGWLAALALTVIAAMFVLVLIFRPERFEFAGLGFGASPKFDYADIVPAGAIVAFSSHAESPSACPKGWAVFEEGRGRFIVGSGAHSNKDSTGRQISVYSVGEFGGEESHNLTLEEMPSHSHSFVIFWSDRPGKPIDGAIGVNWEAAGYSYSESQKTGGGLPHNNVPPFVSLTYCKKDKIL
ncbi:MAG: hypothetical protein KF914_12455 [Rhizobiaceae bacterium]|nr:hypothetical protein [Rhizobiaceae bacterium]